MQISNTNFNGLSCTDSCDYVPLNEACIYRPDCAQILTDTLTHITRSSNLNGDGWWILTYFPSFIRGREHIREYKVLKKIKNCMWKFLFTLSYVCNKQQQNIQKLWYTKSVKRKCTLNKKKSVPHTRILHHTDESVPAFLSTFNGINTSCKTNKHNIHNNYNVQTRRLTHSSTDTQTSHSAQTHMYVG